MKGFVPLALCALVLCSCAPPKHDVAQVRKIIEEMTKKAEKEMLAGVMDTTMKYYAEDAVSMPNNGPMLKGKPAIREYYSQMMSQGIKVSSVSFTTRDVQVSGDFAFEVGTYTMTIQVPQVGEMSEDGKYLTVYEKAKDGTWKIKVETYNSNKIPPMPGVEG